MATIDKNELPEIEYDLRALRKNEDISDEKKMAQYKKAKETQKMFKKMTDKKVKINMNIFDRAYFEVKGLIENLKNKIALPEPKRENIIDKTATDSKAETEVSPTAKKLMDQYRVEVKKIEPVVENKENVIENPEHELR